MEHYDYCQGKIKQKYKCVCFNLAGNLEAYTVDILFLMIYRILSAIKMKKEMPHTFDLDSSSFLFLKIYTRLPYIFHRVLQKLLKEHAGQNFLGHVQLLMMMQEVCKLDMLLKIYFCKRGLWIGVLCEPRPCVTTTKERSYSKLLFRRSVRWRQRISILTEVCHSCSRCIPPWDSQSAW